VNHCENITLAGAGRRESFIAGHRHVITMSVTAKKVDPGEVRHESRARARAATLEPIQIGNGRA
jgi:hypothetical protein